MRAKTRGCLSAKMRAGFEDAAGAVSIARRIEAAGAVLLTVHPRRRVDFFDGVADWRIIAEIKAAVAIPVIGNGDVWYAADALRMLRETGCDGVMIGRGALRNPWIFSQIDALVHERTPVAPSGDDLLQHVAELERLCVRRSGEPSLGMLKEQARYLTRTLPDGGALLRAALRATSSSELWAVLTERLSGLPAAALDLGALGGTLERSGGVLPSAFHGCAQNVSGRLHSRDEAGAGCASML
ncbi:MAG TPA: tRNA-dihydrouridine synthase family protein, partial [Polyangiaceae bacterium]|nr:tRNA-dihydrouridine synthase family protein [Polyangiaceae bacterium]